MRRVYVEGRDFLVESADGSQVRVEAERLTAILEEQPVLGKEGSIAILTPGTMVTVNGDRGEEPDPDAERTDYRELPKMRPVLKRSVVTNLDVARLFIDSTFWLAFGATFLLAGAVAVGASLIRRFGFN
jgi:hypothetical protein